jgi:ADP-heptose:LPS heptosyltransferase
VSADKPNTSTSSPAEHAVPRPSEGVAPSVPERVLFVIRSKLGDSLVAFSVAQAFAKQFPQSDVTVLMRAGYAKLTCHELGLRVIPFENRLGLWWWLVRMRFAPRFDALAVLWGFGPAIAMIARMAKMRRKVYMDNRFGALFDAWPTAQPDERQVDPMWRTAQLVAPSLERPHALALPGLVTYLRSRYEPRAVGIVPVADEARRTLGVAATQALVEAAKKAHPGKPIWLLLNPSDRFAAPHLAHAWGEGIEVKHFGSPEVLLETVAQLSAFYGIDSGLYHLCVALGMPTTG